jgi:hypothetical protein
MARRQAFLFRVAYCLAPALFFLAESAAAAPQWYSQGDFQPSRRVSLVIRNELASARTNSPVVIKADQLPQEVRGAHELTLTPVDPAGTPRPEPDRRARALGGAHGIQGEQNGRAVDYQLDDLDKDGVWDELFFIADLKPGETKVLHLYIGFQQRGWNPHHSFAGIGSYMRHIIPFWESQHVGWKLWFPTDVDVYGKRKGALIASRILGENLDGYAVGLIDPALGTDIQSVDDSFGGGGIGLFDGPGASQLSRPRFSPAADAEHRFNGNQLADTRYSFDVVVNGPLRSMIKVRTMNWNSGRGRYALEQVYTAYAFQNYATARVRFTRFEPEAKGARFAAGIRKRPGETMLYQHGGVVVSTAPETLRNPDDREGVQAVQRVAYAGSALVVKDEYRPEYRFVPEWQGNHVFRFGEKADGAFEYMIAAGWSEGEVLKSAAAFRDYVIQAAREYNSPVRLVEARVETR